MALASFIFLNSCALSPEREGTQLERQTARAESLNRDGQWIEAAAIWDDLAGSNVRPASSYYFLRAADSRSQAEDWESASLSAARVVSGELTGAEQAWLNLVEAELAVHRGDLFPYPESQ